MTIQSQRVALILLFFVSLIWGFEFSIIDMAVKTIPVLTFDVIRFGLAGLALLPLWLIVDKSPISPQLWRKLLVKASILGLLLSIGFYAQTEGLRYTSVSNAGFITSLNVPLVPILSLLFLRTRIARIVWLGVLLATVGLYLLTIGDKLEFNRGDSLVLICAFAFAMHIVLTGRYVETLPLMPLAVIQLFVVALSSLIAVILSPEPAFYFADQTPRDWLSTLSVPIVWSTIVFVSLFGTAYTYWAQLASQKILPDYKVAMVFSLEPIFAAITAWILLGERMGILGFMGASAILIGMLIAELGDNKNLKLPLPFMRRRKSA